jgi:hypothetical protein
MPRVGAVRGNLVIFLVLRVHQLGLCIVLRRDGRLLKVIIPAEGHLCLLNAQHVGALGDVHRAVRWEVGRHLSTAHSHDWMPATAEQAQVHRGLHPEAVSIALSQAQVYQNIMLQTDVAVCPPSGAQRMYAAL